MTSSDSSRRAISGSEDVIGQKQTAYFELLLHCLKTKRAGGERERERSRDTEEDRAQGVADVD